MPSLRLHGIAPLACVVLACGTAAPTHTAPDAGATGTPPSADAGTPERIDGRVLFRGLGEGVLFDVVMFREPVDAPAPIVRGDGHCDIHESGADDGISREFAPGDLDLGATVTASSGALAVTADAASNAGGFQYIGTKAGVDGFGRTWTLANSGSPSGLAATPLATVHVPARVDPIVPPPGGGSIDASSGHLTLEWTGGAGADNFHVSLHSMKADIDCYPPATATRFEVPAEVMKLLDAQVSPAIWAESIAIVPMGERRLWVRVTSDNLD